MPLLAYDSDEIGTAPVNPQSNTGGGLVFDSDDLPGKQVIRPVSSDLSPDAPPTEWGDIPHALAAGTHGALADAAGAVAATAEGPRTAREAQEFATQQEEAAKASEGGMTARAQQPGFLSHPLSSTAEALPGMVPLVGAAALGSAVAGPVGGALATSGVMGAQGLGAAQNRAAGQGIELSPAEKAEQFGIGAAAGAVPELGIPGKIATSPLIRAGLGILTDAGAFGGSAAGGEAISETGEIAAGKRGGYSPSDLGGAFTSGASQGAVFGAAHGLHGTGQAKTQTGGEATVGRRTPEQAASEAKPRASTAPVDMSQKPGVSDSTTGPYSYDPSAPGSKEATPAAPTVNMGPPPPAPKVDADQAAALNPAPVTPRVIQPEVVPAKVVQPEVPTTIQPEAQPLERPVGAPPEGVTTEARGTPPETPEPQPPLAPAPPREDTAAVQPEPSASLAEQHAALTDPANPREAMLYPKGSQVIDIADKSAFGQVKLPDGRVVQYDKNGPSNLTAAKVRQYAKDDRLNEALQLGPVSKDEALSRVAAGETPAVVTERTPDKTEVKAAAGTEATVPAQVADLEANKTPGNVVDVERPEDVDAARQAGVAQDQVVQPTVANPQGKLAQTPFGPGRILEAQDETNVRARNEAAFQEAQQARSVQDQLKAKQAAKEAEQEAAPKARSHTAKGEQAKVASDNIAAKKIVDKYPAPEQLDNVKRPTIIYDRAKAMVNEAKQAGIKISETFPEGHPYNGAMLKLREAADLTAKANPKGWDPYARFLDRERLIDAGKEKEAFEARRNEGALGTGSVGLEGAEEGVAVRPGEHEAYEASPEEHMIRAEEEKEREGGEEGTEALEGRDDRTGIEEHPPLAEPRARPPVVSEAKEGVHYSAGKTAVGFQKVTTKSRRLHSEDDDFADEFNRTMRDGERSTDGVVKAENERGEGVDVTPKQTLSSREALDKHFDVNSYPRLIRPMVKILMDRLKETVGDVPVHFISPEDMERLTGRSTTNGFYDPNLDHIMIRDGRHAADTVAHEVFHAATNKAVFKDAALRNSIQRLMDEIKPQLDAVRSDLTPAELSRFNYAMRNEDEFITGIMTNPDVQNAAKHMRISPELAEHLQIPKWRKATVWSGFITRIMRKFGLEPRYFSAIEAVMSVSEQATWKRNPAAAMEFSSRLDSAEGRAPRLAQEEAPPERDQEAFTKSIPEKIASVKGIDRDVAKQYAKDVAGNLGTTILGKTAKILSGTQLSDLHGKLFTDAKGNILAAINRARDKVSYTYNEARHGDRDTINRGYLLDQKYRSSMPDYAELVNMSARYNIHADRDAPKVPKSGAVNAPRRNWQANANYDKARALYDKLPTELQSRYRSEKQYYMDKQKELANTVLDKVLPVLDLPKDMEERVRNQDLTDEDWEKLSDMKADTTIKNAQRLLNKKDVYFPGQRNGNYVVTGRYEMPKGGAATDFAGEQLADNKREFNTEQEAHDYVTATHMPASVRETTYWTDPATGKSERKTAGEAASSGKITNKYEVSLERQHTEMHDTHAEAAKARGEMEKAGVGELSNVLDKRNERAWSSIGSGEQQALERRIMNRDNLTSVEKQHLIESTRQLALGSQNGMAPYLLGARKVAGAKMDSAEGLDRYSRAINQFIARNSHSVELNQAMGRLDEHENTTRGDTDATTRSIIGNTMRDRVYDQSTGTDSKVSPLLHRLMTMSFINFLVRPSHIFLSQVHPYVYSVPMMASRHGYWAAMKAQKQAMSDLGGQLANLKRGAQSGADVFKSLREQDTEKAVQLAHGADPIRDMIGRLTDKGERAALMKMYETQHLHSAYDQSMFVGGGVDRTNVMMQQFTNAMEANNRLSTALAAYRLEKGMHGDNANALQYAQRVIEETHGIYSASNTAPIFKNPLLRATLQFHQQPMNLAFMLYRNAYKAFRGDTEARWTLAYQLGTAAMLGGMGGMPMDLPKLAGLATMPVTGMKPSDWDDKMRRGIADTVGSTATNAIMEGLPGLMGPLGPSLGHRMGFDAGLLNDEPSSASSGDIMSWVGKNVAGAPGGMLLDWLDGMHALEGGDFQKAGEKFLPGSLKDFAKAYRLGTSGVQVGGKTIRPASYGDAMLQTLGFSGVERERQMEGHYKLQEALKNQPKTVAEQLKAKQAAKWAGNYPMGVKPTAKNAPLIKDYRNAYQ